MPILTRMVTIRLVPSHVGTVPVTSPEDTSMDKKIATWAVAIAALACAGSVQAHHSMSMFDVSSRIWVKGTVVRYEVKDPHVLIALEEKTEDGQVKRWVVEGPNLLRLKRMGVGRDFLKAGDVIEICGFPFKAEITQKARPADGPSLPSMHGHMVVMPDGRMRLFGPYGKLDNCIRPHDTTQSWVNFLNADPLGREAWCKSRSFVRTPSTPQNALADEIDKLMADPCR